MGLGRGEADMDQLPIFFEKVIGLQQEGHGIKVQTLEAVLKVDGGGRVEI